MKTIQLTQGKEAIVDDEDYDRLIQWYWCVSRMHKRWCAVNTFLGKMHRYILNYPSSPIDHINKNGLDNRKENLRICTKSQNAANADRRRTNTSGYKGVDLRSNGKWRAKITVKGETIHLGNYFTIIEAAEAYDRAAKKYFGEFAKCNI